MVASSKRRFSDSDSDYNDDHFDEASPSEQGSPVTEHGGDRKRRRGMIEKKRRDRINNSLNEMKNLIPTACERQTATKLEKSEILQMAVEHIKMLQSRDTSNPHAMAMDYRSIGYRECIGEVMSYLTNVEGLTSHDPLHMRLVSHLHKQASYIEQSYTGSPVQHEPQNYATTQYFKQELCSPSNYHNQPPRQNNFSTVHSTPTTKDIGFNACQPNMDTCQNQLSFSFSWPQSQISSTTPISYQPQCSWV